mmetsp:Transcript_69445/g.168055  ORF Transcript_69445/g.168055 Transcript_69445/m.168055 type:complete len:230 (-) Transcript_69445:83-772(-)
MGCTNSRRPRPPVPSEAAEGQQEPVPSCIFESQSAVRSTNWNFVGRGNGAYDAEPSYSYVGEGRGDWAQQPQLSYRLRRVRPECIWFLAFILVACILGFLVALARSRGLLRPALPAAPAAVPAAAPAPAPRAAAPDPGGGGAGPQPRFNCEDGLANWKQKWSLARQQYCCSEYGRGCPPRTLVHWDCSADISNWVEGWSTTKKAYCCKNEHKGCPGQESLGDISRAAAH